MLKFSVGYQLRSDGKWVDSIIANKVNVNEVFFAPFDMPNGRTGEWVVRNNYSLVECLEMQMRDLGQLAAAGVSLNVLFNAGCYGKLARSKHMLDGVVARIGVYRARFGLCSVTTTSPFIAEAVKESYPDVLTRASINMDICSPQAMDYIAPYFDGYYLKREFNRNIDMIKRMRRWCDVHGKQLLMLANSGCLNDCSVHTFHNNLVAHGNEIEDVDRRYPLRGCRDYLQRPGRLVSLVRDTNWIRPEDIHRYEGLFDSIKLATRVNPFPERILEAYVTGKYSGSIFDLTEPDHSFPLKGARIENDLFPPDFGERVMCCDHRCERCGYCESVFAKVYHKKAVLS